MYHGGFWTSGDDGAKHDACVDYRWTRWSLRYRREKVPIYCYSDNHGNTVERDFPAGEAAKYVKIKGKTALRDYRAESVGVPATTGWPLTCVASGVNAGEAQELRDFYKKHSCPTDVTVGGDPVYKNKAHRDRALKLRGIVDKGRC